MRGELIRTKLHLGQRVYGTHMSSLMNPLSAKIAQTCQLDYVFICTEHMPLDRTETSMMCQFYAAHDISPIVRIPDPQPHWAAMALDAGAQGIVAPYLETVEETRNLVGAVKYRPIKGQYLQQYLKGQKKLTDQMKTFLNRFNQNNYLILGVESEPAVNNLDNLLAVPGVDGVFLGPHDITVSMGIPEQYDHPAFIDLIESVVIRCRKAEMGVGLHYTPAIQPEHFQRFINAGMNWILYAADIILCRDGINGVLRTLRKQNGDVFSGTQDNPPVSLCFK